MAADGAGEVDGLAVEAHLAAVAAVDPEQDPRDLGAARRPRARRARRSRRRARRTRCRGRRRPGSGRSPRAGRRRSGSPPWGTATPSGPTMWRIRSAVVSSPCCAVTTCRPSRNTVARSHRAKTSSRRWLTNRIATPRSRRRRTIVNSRSTSWADSDAVGSSRIRTRASTDRALAISISCWSAIDRPRTGAPTSNWTSSSANSAWAALRIARQSMEPAGGPRGRGR